MAWPHSLIDGPTPCFRDTVIALGSALLALLGLVVGVAPACTNWRGGCCRRSNHRSPAPIYEDDAAVRPLLATASMDASVMNGHEPPAPGSRARPRSPNLVILTVDLDRVAWLLGLRCRTSRKTTGREGGGGVLAVLSTVGVGMWGAAAFQASPVGTAAVTVTAGIVAELHLHVHAPLQRDLAGTIFASQHATDARVASYQLPCALARFHRASRVRLFHGCSCHHLSGNNRRDSHLKGSRPCGHLSFPLFLGGVLICWACCYAIDGMAD